MTAFRIAVAVALFIGVTAPSARAGDSLARLQEEIRELAKRGEKAVVKVTAEQELSIRKPIPDEVLAGLSKQIPAFPEFEKLLSMSSMVTTGFLIAEDLVVTTNAVAGAGSVQVEFAGGTVEKGEVIGSDEFFPVALIRIPKVRGVTVLELSGDDELPAGSIGVFLGRRYGVASSISLGIVSGRSADSGVSHPLSFGPAFDNYFVMNAPVQPGEGGGPLIGPSGKVVAMGVVPRMSSSVMQIAGSSGGGRGVHLGGMMGASPGMGHLVTARDLKWAIGEIVTHGRVRNGRIGVFLDPNSLEVKQVREDGPAWKAGVKRGDVLVSVGETAIASGRDLVHVLRRTPVGQTIALRLRRTSFDGGEARTDELQIGVAPEEAPDDRVVLLKSSGRHPMDPSDLVRMLGLFEFEDEDVVVTVNGKPVESREEVRRILTAEAGAISIRIVRDGERVEVRIEK